MVIGVIAEYNPFHNGHYYHLNYLKKNYPDSLILIALTGNFTQRGEPTLANKWTRAQWAIEAGADLVFEIPFALASGNAETYAEAGTRLLYSLGANYLSFGVQVNAKEAYTTLAKKIYQAKESSSFQKDLKTSSLPQALEKNLTLSSVEKAILRSPNDILALEYHQAILKNKLPLQVLPLQRIKSKDSFKEIILSASNLRELAHTKAWVKAKPAMPDFSYQDFYGLPFSYEERLKDLFVYNYHFHPEKNPPFADPGIQHYLYKHWILKNQSLDQIANKKYTQAHLQRSILHLVFGLDKNQSKEVLEKVSNYHRLLAGQHQALSYLRPFQVQTRFIKGLQSPLKQLYEMSQKESLLRDLLLQDQSPSEFKQGPILL